MILSITAAIGYPLLLGKPREPYSYSGFISNVIEAVCVTILAARVLGWV